MKRIIYSTILIFVFYFTAFAQTENILCPKIDIKAPEYVNENDGTFKVSASFQNDSNSLASKFDWIIIKNKEVLRKYSETTIELDTKIFDKEYWVEILVGNENAECKELARSRVLIIPNVGSPLYLISEYANISWNEERANLNNLLTNFQKLKDFEIHAYFEFKKETPQNERLEHLRNVLNYLSSQSNFQKNQITFLVSETNNDFDRFIYQGIEKQLSDQYNCDNCLVIRGEDLERIVKLFQPTPKTKNLK